MIAPFAAFHRLRGSSMRLALLAASLGLAFATPAGAQESFKTPDEAVGALVNAARAEDTGGLLDILGADAKDIVSSGDATEDAATLKRFLTAYDAAHAIAMDGEQRATLTVGQDEFPFPIPLIRQQNRWWFDTAAGRDEILYRRIGRNELDVIQAALAYVDAQDEYADRNPAGFGVGVYAQRFVSREGQRDGLYWPSKAGEEESPLGAFAAKASNEGYRVGGARAPFHGYYFKILTRQGQNAPGGVLDYVMDGKMRGGFALIAYPARYQNSGVMTFEVNHDGVVFQKDLGRNTEELAKRINSFDPDRTWQKVDVPEPQT
jgi:hypothetical protein